MSNKKVTVIVKQFLRDSEYDQYDLGREEARKLIDSVPMWVMSTNLENVKPPLSLDFDFLGVDFLSWLFVDELYKLLSNMRKSKVMFPEGIFSDISVVNLSSLLEELFEAVKSVREDVDSGIYRFKKEGHPFDKLRPKLYPMWRAWFMEKEPDRMIVGFLDSPMGQPFWDRSPYAEYTDDAIDAGKSNPCNWSKLNGEL